MSDPLHTRALSVTVSAGGGGEARGARLAARRAQGRRGAVRGRDLGTPGVGTPCSTR
ncbi:MAG: hypothetical protein U0802_19685 [Candidatus Binatia bacterium]